VTSNGQVFPYGDATNYGDPSEGDLNSRITAMSAVIPGAGSGLEAVEDVATGQEDEPTTIDPLANDKPPAGNATLSLAGVTPPQRGTAQVNGNRITYQPAPEYNGPDSFTYTVSSSDGASATGTVQVTVASVDDKPDAIDDKIAITDGAPATIDVVANDTGLGDGLKGVSVTQDPAHGTAAVGPDNRISYTPASGFNGTDDFEYRIVDSDDDVSKTGKVAITIGGANHLPVAADDTLTARSGREHVLNVTSNDDVADGVKEVRFTGPDGAPIDSVDIGSASGGIARRAGSKITYTAPTGTFTGPDEFKYVVVDTGGDVSQPATVKATVVRNQSPQVKNGTVDVPQNRTAQGSIAKLGWDPEKDSITFVLRSSPAGQLTLKPDGSFVYQAPAGGGVDAFTFVATDGNSESNEGRLQIQVTDAATTPSTTTTTEPPSNATTDSTSDSSSTTSQPTATTTTTTRKSSSTPPTTASSDTTDSTQKPSGKSKKQNNSSNNRGKAAKSKSKR
jgi:hypothetical protein